MSESAFSAFTKRSIYFGYLPATPVIHRKFLEDYFRDLPEDHDPPTDPSPPVKAFLEVLVQAGILGDVAHLFDGAVEQAGEYHKWADPNPDYRVKNFDDFLNKVDKIVVAPPKFYKAKVDGHTTVGEPIGLPLYLIFDLISNTSAAYTLLTRPDVNEALRALLQGWGKYLEGPGSNATLNKDGWFSVEGLHLLEAGLGGLTFEQTYFSDDEHDPFKYNSWDSFFTRRLKPEYKDAQGITRKVRPIPPQPSGPGAPFYLYNPCESTTLRTAMNVQLHDTFWLKSQKYSLFDMLGGYRYPELSKFATDLKGGSVMQAFLAPQDYHRFHSPVVGKVLKSGVIEGTYYAVLPDEGAPEYDPDLLPGDPHGAIIRSQPWLSVSATRAVFVIEPDANSPIALVAFISIGMLEVSSCDITYDKRQIPNPDHVDVGDQLGMFHFGGSSYALVVKLKEHHELIFQDIFNSPVRTGQHRWINSVIGQVWNVES